MNLALVYINAKRGLLKSIRRPVHLSFSLLQPMFWMLFFGFLMGRFSEGVLPEQIAYKSFLLPGICAMTVLLGASQAGINLIRDMQSGFLQRMVMTSAPHWALHLGKVIGDVIRLLFQALAVLLLGLSIGVEITTSLGAFVLGIVNLALFGFAFSSLSCWIALNAKRPETMATFVHAVNMPIFFTSTALVPNKVMPDWLGTIAAWNPLSLVVDGLRDAFLFERAPSFMEQTLVLLILAIALGAIATWGMYRGAHVSAWESR